MNAPATYTSPRYLASKATLDDRSRHPRLYTRFLDALATSFRHDESETLRLFEMGGGVGTLCSTVLDDLLARSVSSVAYTMVDTDADATSAARTRLAEWGRSRSMDVFATDERLVVAGPEADLSIQVCAGDALAHLGDYKGAPYHGIVAQAVLDIVHVPTALRRFRSVSQHGTHWYLPIHFDGVTAFEPTVDADLDAQIERLFHASMHGRAADHGDKGGPHTGRALLTALADAGASLVDAAGSDWVVVSDATGHYPGDEAYFLHHILHFVESELTGHPDLDADAFDAWMQTRRAQVASGELIYLAHQLDVLGRVDA